MYITYIHTYINYVLEPMKNSKNLVRVSFTKLKSISPLSDQALKNLYIGYRAVETALTMPDTAHIPLASPLTLPMPFYL